MFPALPHTQANRLRSEVSHLRAKLQQEHSAEIDELLAKVKCRLGRLCLCTCHSMCMPDCACTWACKQILVCSCARVCMPTCYNPWVSIGAVFSNAQLQPDRHKYHFSYSRVSVTVTLSALLLLDHFCVYGGYRQIIVYNFWKQTTRERLHLSPR